MYCSFCKFRVSVVQELPVPDRRMNSTREPLNPLRRISMVMLAALFALAGCQSTRFGPMLAPAPLQVALDAPTPVVRAASQDSQQDDFQRIDLDESLRLAGIDNPTIAIADEVVRANVALRTQARALLFPTLDAGANVRVHRGELMTGRGRIINVDVQSLYFGFGADAKGSGTVTVPGLRLVSHLGDAYYAPQAAQTRVFASQFNAATTRQYMLMEVGIRYLALAEAEARRAAFRESLNDFGEIERLTAAHVKAGQGRDSDAQRAVAEASFIRADVIRMNEDVDVAAAELARLLDIDPTARLRPADVVPPIIELVDRRLPLPELLEQTLVRHPEIIARSADVDWQQIRVKQERMRPFLPTIAVGLSAGDFGGGTNATSPRIGSFNVRTDLDAVAVWQVQNLFMGNRALQNASRAGLEMAFAQLTATVNRIREEVADAHALTEARWRDIELARSRIETSKRAYDQDLLRIRNLKGLPLEVLLSARQLSDARQDLVRALSGYSQAQLRLFAALGNTPSGR
jgi:outer membrane protein TolC